MATARTQLDNGEEVAVLLKGDLTTTALASLLTELATESMSGCLHIIDSDGDEAPGLRQGRPGLLRLRTGPPALARRPSGLLRSPRPRSPRRGPRGPAQRAPGLAARRAARPPRLRRAARRRGVRRRAGPRLDERPDALAGRDWRFRKNEKAREDVAPAMPVNELLAEVAWRHTQWNDIAETVHGPAAVPVLSSRAPASADIMLDADAWSLLCKVDNERALAELARECGYTLYEAGQIVYRLVQAGLLDVEEDLAAEPERRADRITRSGRASPRPPHRGPGRDRRDRRSRRSRRGDVLGPVRQPGRHHRCRCLRVQRGLPGAGCPRRGRDRGAGGRRGRGSGRRDRLPADQRLRRQATRRRGAPAADAPDEIIVEDVVVEDVVMEQGPFDEPETHAVAGSAEDADLGELARLITSVAYGNNDPWGDDQPREELDTSALIPIDLLNGPLPVIDRPPPERAENYSDNPDDPFGQSIARVSEALSDLLGPQQADYDPFEQSARRLQGQKAEAEKPQLPPEEVARRERIRTAAAAELAAAHAGAEAERRRAAGLPVEDELATPVVDLQSVRAENERRETERLGIEEQTTRELAERAASEEIAWSHHALWLKAARMSAEFDAYEEHEEWLAELADAVAFAEVEAWARARDAWQPRLPPPPRRPGPSTPYASPPRSPQQRSTPGPTTALAERPARLRRGRRLGGPRRLAEPARASVEKTRKTAWADQALWLNAPARLRRGGRVRTDALWLNDLRLRRGSRLDRTLPLARRPAALGRGGRLGRPRALAGGNIAGRCRGGGLGGVRRPAGRRGRRG